ncbi:hypothetical protein BKG95_09280 [Rodentibacter pneumotropicus]|uniref:Uncharacterized protein n=1 Tax=Rodentibacter pneumotropicus TaxID=758 RepID=A0AAW5L7F3_9PAST|nr:hypothetical protein [Rodentibacter pneumotropicus]MCQ9120408.1 hypothetical protein [Rodentibacter pneumotropicus]OOF66874.1 hypothetical protein BKG95_09280 [Rodentibacter pneumotropicus]
MNFIHIEQETVPNIISLHDCVCTSIQVIDNKIYFEFEDGFVVLNTHSDNQSGKHLKSEKSCIVFSHDDPDIEYYYDIEMFHHIYFLNKYLFTTRKFIDFSQLYTMINSKEYELEFISLDKSISREKYFLEAELIRKRKRKHFPMFIKIINTHNLQYKWNSLCMDREIR